MAKDEKLPWHRNDALFKRLQKTGRSFEALVAARLIDEGIGVRVDPMRTRPTVESRRMYRDKRDIIALCPGGFEAEIKVKSRAVPFTGPDDFPHKTIFVDAKELIDEKGPPTAVVCVSQRTGAMMVIPESSRRYWEEKTSMDRVRQIERTWYVCPKDLLRSFDDLVRFLMAR
jgi:hypothetical protein